MEIKFFTEEKVLDLSGQKVSVQESNSKMNDKLFSKYFFPFEIYMDEEFINAFGDYESDDADELEDTFIGPLLFENRLHTGKLELGSTQGKLIEGQMGFGFEDLPNSEKKLAELPLHKFKVSDIHTYAREIAAKKYPETDFNFPRMYTSKYPPDQAEWDAFDGYYNDLKTDGTEMRRNYIDELGDIYNINIIHPTPHFLYVLKAVFKDAGLLLAGDILTDPIFSQRWIFSGTEYFSRLTQLRAKLEVQANDYDSTSLFIAYYNKLLTIPLKGKYRLTGYFLSSDKIKGSSVASINMNGLRIWNFNKPNSQEEKRAFNIEITTETENTVLNFNMMDVRSSTRYEIIILAEVINLELSDTSTYDGEDNGVITNMNEIDLARAVPDMTCSDLVNHVRNRFNYGLDVVDNIAYMNRLADEEPTEAKDFRQFEVSPANRKKTLLRKRSFLLRSTELDDGPQASMYFDKDGAFLNKKENPETIIIESNVIILQTGVPKPNGYNTAIIKKDTQDALQLVWYDGLTAGQNNAKNPAGAEYPELFYSHWDKWLRQRIRGYEFQWKFYCPAEEFTYRITDHIFAYNNIHNIKTWTKDLVEGTYEVDIVTETI